MAARPRFRSECPFPSAGVILPLVLVGVCPLFGARTGAQSQVSLEFDVVSIKRVDEVRPGGGMRTLPDGTFIMTNQPLGTLINLASPVPVALGDIVGMPEWLRSEPYDVTAKPPMGWTREQLAPAYPAMWRAALADRMKLVGHVEQRERDSFALVLARGDGRLGPGLKPSTLDCTPRPDAAPPTRPEIATSLQERRNRCGLSVGRGVMVSGGVTLVQLARSMGGLAGGEVEDRTGLMGAYAVDLTFSLQRSSHAALNGGAPVNDAPDFVTALQDQLGLKLQREKRMMPVYVIDHVERPSAN